MLPSVDRWKRLETLFYESLQLPPEARSAFLAESCGSDTKLREEVEALLKEAEGSMDLLQQPISDAAQGLVAETERDLAPGIALDHYEVISLLARGGMGQVYLAEDTILKRKVALKVLAPEFLNDEHGLRRFQREALAASALNHPNIVTIYGCGNINGVRFIVSEYVNGITLRETLSNSKLDLETVLNIAVQLAEALAVAHSAGIIHRDIKPENIMVRDDGLVKILDFGIAKLSRARGVQPIRGAPDSSVTSPGILIGTVAYMSPEQVTGEELDARTDLFSLGIVLYEMVSGSPPFVGENAGAIIHKLLTEEPFLPASSDTQISSGLETVISKALQKKRDLRYQNASEMRSDLQHLKQASESALVKPPPTLWGKPSPAAGKRRLLWFAVAGLLLAMVLLAAYLGSRRKTQLTDKDTVVLADFNNATGDPVFDGTLRQGLSAQLEQSPFLNLLSDERTAQTLSLMAQPRDTRLTGAVAREVCQRTASAATIDGSIASLGNQYVLGLKAVNCRNGDLLAQEQVTADGKEQVLKALGEAAINLRSRLGESLASVQKYDAAPDSVTTASLEALQAYSLACRKMIVANNYVAAIPLFQRAISLDSNFAMAYARLGTNYFNLGEAERGAENLRKAYELRQTVSERERFYIDSHYEMFVSGNADAARKTLELWWEVYPRDEVAPNNLGFIYMILGEYDKAVAAFQEALRLNPGKGNSVYNLAFAYTNLNRLDDAEATAQQAQARHVETPLLHIVFYFVDFLKNDVAGMQRQVDSQLRKPGSEDTMLYYESDTAASEGRLARARELTKRAIDSAQHADEKETAAGYQAESAVREALAGNMGMAREQAQAALALSTGRDVESMAAIALALAGRLPQATRLADGLAQRFPEDTIVQFNYVPSIRAATAIESGSPDKAIQVLAAAVPYELGGPANQSPTFCLYPVYLRGLALLGARQGSAAAEFQKILDHPGVVLNEPIGALARLGLGRSYAVAGDKEKARKAYEDFFALWKDADRDVPILNQAKDEYAMLR